MTSIIQRSFTTRVGYQKPLKPLGLAQRPPKFPGPPPTSASKVYHDPRSTPQNCSMKETILVASIIQRSFTTRVGYQKPLKPLGPAQKPPYSQVHHQLLLPKYTMTQVRSTPPNCSMKETIPVTSIIQRSFYHPCRPPKATKATWPSPKASLFSGQPPTSASKVTMTQGPPLQFAQ